MPSSGPSLCCSSKASAAASVPVSSGIIEGFKVEKASLQEALGQKETAEQGLAVELESLRQQLQRATQQQAELKEENSALWTQKEALAAEAEEREAGKNCRLRRRRAGPGAADLVPFADAHSGGGQRKEGRGPGLRGLVRAGWRSAPRIASPFVRGADRPGGH